MAGDLAVVPNFNVFDLELAAPVSGRRGFAEAHKAGISVLSSWGLRDFAPMVWLLDSSRLPRVFLSEDHAVKHWETYEGVVSWNGLNFDDGVLQKRAPNIRKTYVRQRHIDLHAICCLIQAGVDPARIAEGLKKGWASMVPTMREDLLNVGWHLDAVGAGTLGYTKVGDSEVTGKNAGRAWQSGRYSEIISYCVGDVGLTRALFLHAWEHGWLESTERGRVTIPREVLV